MSHSDVSLVNTLSSDLFDCSDSLPIRLLLLPDRLTVRRLVASALQL